MGIVVLKFGGTSVNSAEARRHAISHVRYALDLGDLPIVVVSAMGRRGDPYATDTLLGLAGIAASITATAGKPASRRELDLLASCGEVISAAVFASEMESGGVRATALTGWQAGVKTNGRFGNATISQVDPAALSGIIRDGAVPVVAGFQGVGANGEVTTLGRGGSDTSAAAIAAYVGADRCDIYTDVDGIKSADPSIVPEASTFDVLPYAQAWCMARSGAKVVHPRALAIAGRHRVPLTVRSTFACRAGQSGTLVTDCSSFAPSAHTTTAVVHMPDLVWLRLPAQAVDDFEAVIRAQRPTGQAPLAYSSDARNPGLLLTSEAYASVRSDGPAEWQSGVAVDCCRVSVVGPHVHRGMLKRISCLLKEHGIKPLHVGRALYGVYCVVPRPAMNGTVRLLHQEALGGLGLGR